MMITQPCGVVMPKSWSRTRCLRLNTRGLPSDCHKGKKAYIRRPSWHPSGPLISGDALDAGRAGTRRPLRLSSLAASHHYGWLTPPRVVATAAPETAAPRAASRRDRSDLLPWPAYKAATAWLNPSRWSAGAVATARGGWHGASRNYDRHGTRPIAAARRPRPCTTW